MQFLFRFIVGGLIVSLFAVIGDVLKPKSFGGLFGAAPSVALATLGLTIFENGKMYAAVEARSMILGAAAFFVYACFCMRLMAKAGFDAGTAAISGWAVWMLCAIGLWWLVLK